MPALLSQQFSLAPGQGQGQYTSLAVEPEALRRGLLQRRELPPLPENFTRTESRLTTLARRSRRDNTPYTLALETADGKRRRLSTTVAREPQNASGYDSNDDDDSDSDGDELAQALRSSRQHQRRSRVHKSNLDDGLAFMCASTLLYRAPLPEIPRLPRRYAYHVPTAAAATNLPLTGDRSGDTSSIIEQSREQSRAQSGRVVMLAPISKSAVAALRLRGFTDLSSLPTVTVDPVPALRAVARVRAGGGRVLAASAWAGETINGSQAPSAAAGAVPLPTLPSSAAGLDAAVAALGCAGHAGAAHGAGAGVLGAGVVAGRGVGGLSTAGRYQPAATAEAMREGHANAELIWLQPKPASASRGEVMAALARSRAAITAWGQARKC